MATSSMCQSTIVLHCMRCAQKKKIDKSTVNFVYAIAFQSVLHMNSIMPFVSIDVICQYCCTFSFPFTSNMAPGNQMHLRAIESLSRLFSFLFLFLSLFLSLLLAWNLSKSIWISEMAMWIYQTCIVFSKHGQMLCMEIQNDLRLCINFNSYSFVVWFSFLLLSSSLSFSFFSGYKYRFDWIQPVFLCQI